MEKKGKLIVIEPGKEPRTVEHDGDVGLDDLYRQLGSKDMTVDIVRLGPIPPAGRAADLWIDDNGLLNDAKPNFRLPNGVFIAGAALICMSDNDGNSVPMTDEEASYVLEDIGRRWERLGEEIPKPEPSFRVETYATPEELRAARRGKR